LITFELQNLREEQVQILIIFDQSDEHNPLPSCALGVRL
jgi:hypothetical protein